MKLVNRSVLVLKPTAKMLDWINSVGEDSDTVTPQGGGARQRGFCRSHIVIGSIDSGCPLYSG